MNNHLLRVTLIIVISFLFTSRALAQEEFGKKVRAERAFAHHNLQVHLIPNAHFIQGVDDIILTKLAPKKIQFRLRESMLITGLFDEKGNELSKDFIKKVSLINNDQNDFPHLKMYELLLPKDCSRFSLSYEGEIYDPVEEAKTLAFVRGDETTGIISEDGIYLDAGSGWYLVEDGGLATYEMEVMVEKPFVIVAQGDLVKRAYKEAGGQIEISHWKSEVPQDGFTLIGNRFVINKKQVGDVTISTYFFDEDAQLANEYLDATEKYLDFYQNLLGKFPYNRFDIVENFFQTGYGMPGYTLLGSAVIKMHYTGEFAIGHELMHNWWGNYVFFDADNGNWCEALTTYLTNYYWLEASEQMEKALEWRKHASIKYSITVPLEKAYPLKDFRGKENEIDGAIGYEKGAMFFHMIRRALGDEIFFSSLRNIIETKGGEFADWNDFKEAFKNKSRELNPEKSHIPTFLDKMFDDWLIKADAPKLVIDNVIDEPGIFKATVELNEPFAVPINIYGYNKSGELVSETELLLSEGLGSFSIESEKKKELGEKMGIARLEIDPLWHVFRRVPKEAVPPCLNALLNDESAFVVYPSGVDNVSTELAKLVSVIKDSGRKLRIVSDVVFIEEAKKNEEVLKQSMLILGGENVNSAWNVIRELFSLSEFNAGKDSFSLGRAIYDAPNESVLVSLENLRSPGKFVAFYHGNSPSAFTRSRYIFYYGWDSYVIFQDGRPIERGTFPPSQDPWIWSS